MSGLQDWCPILLWKNGLNSNEHANRMITCTPLTKYIYISGEKDCLYDKVRKMTQAFVWLHMIILTVELCQFSYKSMS